MLNNKQLLIYLDELLTSNKYQDYGHNGLQIEGNPNISCIITGVSLSDELIEQAIISNAQAIIVHHGIFWHKTSLALTGIKAQRVAKLLKHNINLYAYHLPLDNHATLGNNAQLAELFNIRVLGQIGPQGLIWHGELDRSITALSLFDSISYKLNHWGKFFTHDPNTPIKTLAWCSGGSQNLFQEAIDLGVDAYLTGEATEYTMSLAKESKVTYYMAGHYATECGGIMALSKYLAKQFNNISIRFIRLPNPI